MKLHPMKLAALAGGVLLPLAASAQINLGGLLNNVLNKAQGKPAPAPAAVPAPAAKTTPAMPAELVGKYSNECSTAQRSENATGVFKGVQISATGENPLQDHLTRRFCSPSKISGSNGNYQIEEYCTSMDGMFVDKLFQTTYRLEPGNIVIRNGSVNQRLNVCSKGAEAQAESPWAVNPSLCEATDYILFSAVFGKKAPGKVLSLCVDREKNPTRLGYRYGPEGNAEMKYDAPADGVFYKTEQTLSPRANLNVLYFEKNGHTFAIAECTGGECADNFKLMVFKGNKLISKQPTKELGSFMGDFPRNLVQNKDSKLDFGL